MTIFLNILFLSVVIIRTLAFKPKTKEISNTPTIDFRSVTAFQTKYKKGELPDPPSGSESSERYKRRWNCQFWLSM